MNGGGPTSTPFSETWPSWGSIVAGELWALATPGLRTEESGCGSWPTATAGDAKNAANRTAGRSDPDSAHHDGVTLIDAVRLTWPTPDANAMNLGESPESWDARRAELVTRGYNGNGAGRVLAVEAARQWQTPSQADADGGHLTRGGDRSDELLLKGQARQWPTPTQRDHKDGSAEACENVPVNALLGREIHQWPTPASDTGSGGPHGLEGGSGNTKKARALGVPSGALHPDWTECLMGWPASWTSLDPLPELVWPALHGLQVAPPGPYQHDWEPPRVATGVKDRAKRLRCIGNGQHPFAAVLAWRLLTDDIPAADRPR